MAALRIGTPWLLLILGLACAGAAAVYGAAYLASDVPDRADPCLQPGAPPGCPGCPEPEASGPCASPEAVAAKHRDQALSRFAAAFAIIFLAGWLMLLVRRKDPASRAQGGRTERPRIDWASWGWRGVVATAGGVLLALAVALGGMMALTVLEPDPEDCTVFEGVETCVPCTAFYGADPCERAGRERVLSLFGPVAVVAGAMGIVLLGVEAVAARRPRPVRERAVRRRALALALLTFGFLLLQSYILAQTSYAQTCERARRSPCGLAKDMAALDPLPQLGFGATGATFLVLAVVLFLTAHRLRKQVPPPAPVRRSPRSPNAPRRG